ncbi:homeobox protein YOX1/YHP1 [Rhodotorula toruloides]|uniref:Homeobox protein YOX1/YHP1 n=1 Tax=Rhodotorula toruloides TaxID=5286 RepID=A0A511K7R4_RHOTO|nr:homeobox protein YOX1/YHP1 [Rhodotorula toruloides]
MSQDVLYHPYRTTKSSSSIAADSLTGITFVDTTQQAAAAATGLSGDGLQQCRPKRKRITPEQLVHLTAIFETTDSPTFEQRETLAEQTGMTNREVQIWFQNRRAKINRQRQAVLAKEEAAAVTAAMDASGEPAPVNAAVKASAEMLSAGQHQWRFRRKKVAQHGHGAELAASPLPLQPSPPFEAVASVAPHPVSSLYPSPPLSYSAQHPLSLGPLSSPILTPGAGSSYFGIASPPLTTPGLASPGLGSASSYFSPQDGPHTPSTMSSPSGHFFRLTLDSPQITPLSPHAASDVYELVSPRATALEAPIHLAPMRSDAIFGRLGMTPTRSPLSRPMHRRSISDSTAHAVLAALATQEAGKPSRPAPPVRLPSLRGLLNDDDSSPAATRPPVLASAPTSPIDARPRTWPAPVHTDVRLTMASASTGNKPVPAYQRPALFYHSSTTDIHPKPSVNRLRQPSSSPARSAALRPSSASTVMAIDVADKGEVDVDTRMRSLTPMSGPVGLGMLVAAASELCEDDERAARLTAASSQMR